MIGVAPIRSAVWPASLIDPTAQPKGGIAAGRRLERGDLPAPTRAPESGAPRRRRSRRLHLGRARPPARSRDPDRGDQRRLGGRAQCRRAGGGLASRRRRRRCPGSGRGVAGDRSAGAAEPAARRRADPDGRGLRRAVPVALSAQSAGRQPAAPGARAPGRFRAPARHRHAAAVHRRDRRRNRARRIFRNPELSIDAVLASACLPQLHQAITIDGEPYWDGGFSANPPLVALVEGCPARDLLLVQINPLRAERTPRTPREIRNRMAEIAFGRPSGRGARAPAARAPGRGGRRRLVTRAAGACSGIACTRSTAAPSWPGSTPAPRWIRLAAPAGAARARLDGRGHLAARLAASARPPRQRQLSLTPEMQRRAG